MSASWWRCANRVGMHGMRAPRAMGQGGAADNLLQDFPLLAMQTF